MKRDYSKSNKSKHEFLGMPHGTASHKLKKMIMFDLLKRLDLDSCFRCGKKIKTVDELSIDHKKPWLYVSTDLFWDLNNIAFSHIKCNTTDRPRGINIPKCKEGFNWCNKCKQCLPIKKFGIYRQSKNGIRSWCNKCRKKNNWDHK